MAVDVDSIQSGDEVYENVVHTLGNLAQECFGNLLVRRVFCQVDGNEKLFGLLVDISNIDTTLVGEKDPITLKRKMSAKCQRCDWHGQSNNRRYIGRAAIRNMEKSPLYDRCGRTAIEQARDLTCEIRRAYRGVCFAAVGRA